MSFYPCGVFCVFSFYSFQKILKCLKFPHTFLLSESPVEQIFIVLLCSIAMCVSTRFFMSKYFPEVGSQDAVTVYTSSSPGIGSGVLQEWLCCCGSACSSKLCGLLSWPQQPVCSTGRSELRRSQIPGELSMDLQGVLRLLLSSVSRPAQRDLLCITALSPDKSQLQVSRGGES